MCKLLILWKFGAAIRTQDQIVRLRRCLRWLLVWFADANLFKVVIFVGVVRLYHCDLGFGFACSRLFTQGKILLRINSLFPLLSRRFDNTLFDDFVFTQVVNSFWTWSLHHRIQLLRQIVVHNSSRLDIDFALRLNLSGLSLLTRVWKPASIILWRCRTSRRCIILLLHCVHHLLHLLDHHSLIL